MSTLRDLARVLNSEVDLRLANAKEKIAKATLVGIDYLVRQTPVDTSRALSNWQIGIGAMPTEYLPAHREGVAGSTRGTSMKIAKQHARALLRKRRVGERIYIANNAPYILRLNNGWSKQHPGGFVQAATMIIRHELGRVTNAARRRNG